jgi:SOS-response transcriptional repressor LexA
MEFFPERNLSRNTDGDMRVVDRSIELKRRHIVLAVINDEYKNLIKRLPASGA